MCYLKQLWSLRFAFEDPITDTLLNIDITFDGPDLPVVKFKNESVVLPYEEYAEQLKFFDSTERNLFTKARNTTGFLYDFQVEDEINYSQPVDIDEVAFLILGCKKLSHRLLSQFQSWIPHTRHYFFFTDKPVKKLPNVIVISSNTADSFGSGYLSAGERHWQSVLWLKREKPELLKKLKWMVLSDDDTWFNIPKLLDVLSNYNPDYNVAVGQVFHDLFTKNRTFLQGGSGMVFSRSASLAISNQLFKPWCRYNKHGDLSLWNCYKVAGTLLVHSDRFHQWSVELEKVENKYILKPSQFVNAVSYHYINNHLVMFTMACDSAVYWNYPETEDCKAFRQTRNGSKELVLAAPTNLRYSFFESLTSSGSAIEEYQRETALQRRGI